jgi:hypothetical protein
MDQHTAPRVPRTLAAMGTSIVRLLHSVMHLFNCPVVTITGDYVSSGLMHELSRSHKENFAILIYRVKLLSHQYSLNHTNDDLSQAAQIPGRPETYLAQYHVHSHRRSISRQYNDSTTSKLRHIEGFRHIRFRSKSR